MNIKFAFLIFNGLRHHERLVLKPGRLFRPAAAFLGYCTCMQHVQIALQYRVTHAELRLARTGKRKAALPVDQGIDSRVDHVLHGPAAIKQGKCDL